MRLRLHAPRGNGDVLAVPGFKLVPVIVEANRWLLNRSSISIGNVRLHELRAQLRAELQAAGTAVPGLDSPLLLGGHQPELSHPGVWVKNFALNGLARRVGGTPLHLVVDCDTVKQASVRLPAFTPGEPDSARIVTLPFDRLTGAPTFEEYRVRERDEFDTFLPRLEELTRTWGYRPLAFDAWPRLDPDKLFSTQVTQLRQHYEGEWGCRNLELPVSVLSRTHTFAHFARHLAADLPRFHAAYNGAIRGYRHVNRVRSRTHPAPELERRGDALEAPFWHMTAAGRTRLFLVPGELVPESIRPRALTLTLFARLVLGDLFIHGIGGGKYDEVTDAILQDFYRIGPPTYQIVSATQHLPLPSFPIDDEELTRARRHVRDLQWNPQRYVVPPSSDDPFVMRLVADRESMASSEPQAVNRAARQAWYRKLADLNDQLRHHVWKQLPPAKARAAQAEAAHRANAILRRRDYSWLLFPESTLRPFLEQFLTA